MWNWNDQDYRICKDDKTNKSFSLYCALVQSQMKYAGIYKHRGIVMKTARKVIKEKASRRFKHPVRDYNNMEGVTIEDVLIILDDMNSIINNKLQ